MDSTLKPKPADDPHDVLVVATDAAPVAPGDDEISTLLRDAARHRSNPHGPAAAGVAPAVPPVDTTFRPAAVNDIRGQRSPIGRWALRGVTAFLLAACTATAGIAWQFYGDTARAMVTKWTPQFAAAPSPPPENPVPSAQPATVVQADATTAASPPPVAPDPAPATAAPAAAAPAPDQTQALTSMARDLASLSQQVEALKAGLEQLKASQQQTFRDAPKATDKTAEPPARPKIAKLSAAPPAPPRPRPRQPVTTYQPSYPPPQARLAPPPPTAAPYPAPYYAPRQADAPPQTLAEPPDDADSSAPRPPMPLRP